MAEQLLSLVAQEMVPFSQYFLKNMEGEGDQNPYQHKNPLDYTLHVFWLWGNLHKMHIGSGHGGVAHMHIQKK